MTIAPARPQQLSGALVADEFVPVTDAELREEALRKARTVIRALRGAGLKPPFGMDDGEAEEVWSSKIGHYDLAALMDAANEFVSAPSREFPTVAEFDAVASRCQLRRNAISAGMKRRIPGQVCPLCQDMMWVYVSGGVVACSVCMPERHSWQTEGHNQHSEAERASCQHPLCGVRGKPRRAS